MAQLGARHDGIEEVVGSNPIGSTISNTVAFFLYILQAASILTRLRTLKNELPIKMPTIPSR